VATTEDQRNKSIKGSLIVERKNRGLTQAALADQIGASPSTVSAWETGDGSIGLEEAWAIADRYGISLDQLAGRQAPAAEA